MTYCTLADILDVMDEADVIGYTDDEDTGSVNTDATDKAISGAAALIDVRVASRYDVPFDPVPDMVKALAVDIAAYKISSRRGSAPEEFRTKFDDAVRLLKDIGSGNAVLPGAASATTSASNDRVTFTADDRIFTRSKMTGF